MTRPVTRYLGGVFTSFYGVGVRLWVGELSAQLFGAQLFGTQLGEIIEKVNGLGIAGQREERTGLTEAK